MGSRGWRGLPLVGKPSKTVANIGRKTENGVQNEGFSGHGMSRVAWIRTYSFSDHSSFIFLVKLVSGLTFAVLKNEFMANHSATKKDARQAAKRRDRNKYYAKTTRNAIRDLKASGAKEMGEQLPGVASMIDKLAKRGVIHKNKAANLKRKLAKNANVAK